MDSFFTGTLYEVFIKNKVLVIINISNFIFIKVSYNAPIRNKIISQSKICKKIKINVKLQYNELYRIMCG